MNLPLIAALQVFVQKCDYVLTKPGVDPGVIQLHRDNQSLLEHLVHYINSAQQQLAVARIEVENDAVRDMQPIKAALGAIDLTPYLDRLCRLQADILVVQSSIRDE